MQEIQLKIRKKGDNWEVQIVWLTSPIPSDKFEISLPPEISSQNSQNYDLLEIGHNLFSKIFTGNNLRFYRQILSNVDGLNEEIAIYLFLDKHSMHILWEAMYDRERRGFLALDLYPRHIFLRIPLLDKQIEFVRRTSRLTLPARVLHIVANPIDAPPINDTQFPELLGNLVDRGVVKIDKITGASTLAKLRNKAFELQNEKNDYSYSILFIEAHGNLSGGLSKIVISDPENRKIEVAPDQLSIALSEFLDIQVILLSSCWSGDFDSSNSEYRYASLARSLIANGFNAVIAMNGPIQEDLVQFFIQAFLIQTIGYQETVARAVTYARQEIYKSHKLSPQAFIPNLYTSLNSQIVFQPVFDSTKIITMDSGIKSSSSILVPVYREGHGHVEVSILSITFYDEKLIIEIKAVLFSEEIDHQIKLGVTKPRVKIGNTIQDADTWDELSVNNRRPLIKKLIFTGPFPHKPTSCKLIFNWEEGDQTTKNPKIEIDQIPLPLKNKPSYLKSSLKSTKDYAFTYNNRKWEILVNEFLRIEEFINFCLASKANWKNAEDWLSEGLLELWAEKILRDYDLVNDIRQLYFSFQEVHHAIWKLLLLLDSSIPFPKIQVLTGTRDGIIHFQNLLLGKTTSKDIKFFHGNPSSVISGNMWPSHDCFLVNNSPVHRFKNHSEDCPIYINLSLRNRKILTLFENLNELELYIQLDDEFIDNNWNQTIRIPLRIKIDPIPFFLSISIPISLFLLVLVGTYLVASTILKALFGEVGDLIIFGILISSVPFIVYLVNFVHNKFTLKVLDGNISLITLLKNIILGKL